jgi:hypothetical protein
MRKQRDLLSPLLALGVGAIAAATLMTNATAATEQPWNYGPRPTLTPDQLIPSVSPTPEGDDGSLGGPVYDKHHQIGNPRYLYNVGR